MNKKTKAAPVTTRTYTGIVQVTLRTEDSGGLLHNFFQLLLAPARHGPLQVPFRTFGHRPRHLLHHKLPREAGGSEDNQVVGPAGGCFNMRHRDRRQTAVAHLSAGLALSDWPTGEDHTGFNVYAFLLP